MSSWQHFQNTFNAKQDLAQRIKILNGQYMKLGGVKSDYDLRFKIII